MGRWSERRALSAEDSEIDTSISIDINEYLISTWACLTLKQRQAVWHSCQNDPDFDWSSIEDQIDEWVEALAEEAGWELPEPDEEETEELTEEEIEQEETEMTEELKNTLADYVDLFWDVQDEERLDAIANNLLDVINTVVDTELDEEQ